MKKVIKGKVYDTEKARVIGCYVEDCLDDSFTYKETLYRDREGEYFVHGGGGANSPYSKWDGSGRLPGEDILRVREDIANEWAKKKLSEEEYELIFLPLF